MMRNVRQKQEGAVLLVSLVLLLITTFVGFSSMETSTLENKMSTARELKEKTFQTSEMGIEDTLDDTARLSAANILGLQGGGWSAWNDHEWAHDANLTATTRIQYLNDAASSGYSVVSTSSGVATFYFEVQSVATRTNTNISSDHTQGIFVEGPRLN